MFEFGDGLSISVYLERNQMGGFGSGRPALHATCEESLKLDLASPATRRALKPNAASSGSWQWSCHGRQIGAIDYLWWGGNERLSLNYCCGGAPVSQVITLVRTAPHFGGARWWFRCPFTGARVRALFLPPGARHWGSRRHHQLTYQSRRESGQDRAMLRLMTRHGGRAGVPLLAAAALGDPDPFGFREQRRWDRREEARARRNEVRRIARRQRAGA